MTAQHLYAIATHEAYLGHHLQSLYQQEVYSLEALRLKLWRFGRVIIDSGLNTGRMDCGEAVGLETREIGFVRETMFHEPEQEFGV